MLTVGLPARGRREGYPRPMAAALFAPSYVLHGPGTPQSPLVLDSPHSGFAFPADFGSVLSEFDLREGEDCFVDELWMPATERGIPLIAALVPRTYIDYNRHAGDIDLELIEGGAWPDEHVPSGKARLGKGQKMQVLKGGTNSLYGMNWLVKGVIGSPKG